MKALPLISFKALSTTANNGIVAGEQTEFPNSRDFCWHSFSLGKHYIPSTLERMCQCYRLNSCQLKSQHTTGIAIFYVSLFACSINKNYQWISCRSWMTKTVNMRSGRSKCSENTGLREELKNDAEKTVLRMLTSEKNQRKYLGLESMIEVGFLGWDVLDILLHWVYAVNALMELNDPWEKKVWVNPKQQCCL